LAAQSKTGEQFSFTDERGGAALDGMATALLFGAPVV
jgi:hypothetical protein